MDPKTISRLRRPERKQAAAPGGTSMFLLHRNQWTTRDRPNTRLVITSAHHHVPLILSLASFATHKSKEMPYSKSTIIT
ncbi:MAG: hypothetical protein PUK81_11095, partial [Firmicutes bacterium]|nr:hypothetical protein [Bacillota bacterium]